MADFTTTYERLTQHLAATNYTFVCPSPETAGRVVQKRKSDSSTQQSQNAQDFFGWSLPCSRYAISTRVGLQWCEASKTSLKSWPFLPQPYTRSWRAFSADDLSRQTLKNLIPDDVFESLRGASIIIDGDVKDEYRSTVRVSNFYLPNVQKPAIPLYYIHSSFPASSDSVFFGPDTYLYIQFLQTAQHHLPQNLSSAIDVCCGSGAGAIHLARTYPQAKVLGLDLNPRALRLGSVNAHLAGAKVDYYESNLYAAVPSDDRKAGIDLIISNPPYIASSADGKDLPMYADGGAEFGLDISLRIVAEGLELLSRRGVIIVYTGVAIPFANPGQDAFLEKLQAVEGAELVEYTILHPDMWPEEIGHGAYADVGRIQVVGAVLKRS